MVPRSADDSNFSFNNERTASTTRTANIQRTPFYKSRVSLHELRRGSKNTNSLDVLEKLLKKPWSAFSVSPLFTWSSRESKLKRYSRRMVHVLAENLPIEEGDSFEVHYKIDHNLKMTANDHSAVEISVNVLFEDSVKPVFVGYLLSWGSFKEARCADLDDVLYLPVMLCAGSKRVTTQVCRGLESIHDCVISPVDLPEFDRKDLWVTLLSFLNNEGETVGLSYVIPNRRNVGSLELTISSDITTKLIRRILKKYGGDIKDDSAVSLFWEEINEYVNDIFGVKVQNCEIVKVQMREAVVTANKFKASSLKAMHAILSFLVRRSVRLESPG